MTPQDVDDCIHNMTKRPGQAYQLWKDAVLQWLDTRSNTTYGCKELELLTYAHTGVPIGWSALFYHVRSDRYVGVTLGTALAVLAAIKKDLEGQGNAESQ